MNVNITYNGVNGHKASIVISQLLPGAKEPKNHNITLTIHYPDGKQQINRSMLGDDNAVCDFLHYFFKPADESESREAAAQKVMAELI